MYNEWLSRTNKTRMVFLFLLRFKWCRQKYICISVYLFTAARSKTRKPQKSQKFRNFFNSTSFKEHIWSLPQYKRFIFVDFSLKKKVLKKSFFNFLVQLVQILVFILWSEVFFSKNYSFIRVFFNVDFNEFKKSLSNINITLYSC